MTTDLIIYDFDGVICDSVKIKTEAFVKMYSNYSLDIQNSVREFHLANGGVSRFEKFKYYESNLLGKKVDQKQILDLATTFSLLVKGKVEESPFINGVIPFIKSKKNQKQFICTGTPELEIKDIIFKKGISHLFNGIFGSPDNKVKIIERIINQTGVKSNNILFFGDTLTDYQAAKEFDIQFVGLKNEFTKFPVNTFLIDDFLDQKLINQFK